MNTLIATLIASSLLASMASADPLSCTLQSGKKKDSVTLNLADARASEDGAYSEQGVYDLSIYLSATCVAADCGAAITINSGIVEDEVGQTGFEFTRGTSGQIVFKDALTDAPDKRKYTLSCQYQP